MTELIRVKLGVDGDHAYALLGPDLQEGEAEFEPIADLRSVYSRRASAFAAFHKLLKRLNLTRKTHSYYLGPGLDT